MLTEETAQKLVGYNWARGNGQMTGAILLCWEFLLRVQSEGLRVWKGCPDDVTGIVDGRTNGLWIDGKGNLVYRLKVRKDRRKGSTLTRSCRCAPVGRLGCAVCCFKTFLADKEEGTLLWDFTPSNFTTTLKRQIVLTHIEGEGTFSLKAFRAGSATDLARRSQPGDYLYNGRMGV